MNLHQMEMLFAMIPQTPFSTRNRRQLVVGVLVLFVGTLIVGGLATEPNGTRMAEGDRENLLGSKPRPADDQTSYTCDNWNYLDDGFDKDSSDDSDYYEEVAGGSYLTWHEWALGDGFHLNFHPPNPNGAVANISLKDNLHTLEPLVGDLHVEMDRNSNGELWVFITHGMTGARRAVKLTSSGTISLDSDAMYGSQFDIDFGFKGFDGNDEVDLLRVYIETPEFTIQEVGGVDACEYDANKVIRVHVSPPPSRDDWEETNSNDICLKYGTSKPPGTTLLGASQEQEVLWWYFWIPSSNIAWGNTYYYLVSYYSASQGWKDSSADCQFPVTDTDDPPEVTDANLAGNTQGVNYTQHKFLNFTVQDQNPGEDPSGVLPSSVKLTFDTSATFAGSPTQLDFHDRAGADYTFAVEASNYNYGDTIYYKLEFEDNAGNAREWTDPAWHFPVIDGIRPQLTLLARNDTGCEYSDTLSLNFTLTDFHAGGSLLKEARLFARQDFEPRHVNGVPTTGTTELQPSNVTTVEDEVTINIEFRVGPHLQLLDARRVFAWEVWLEDNAGNSVSQNWTTWVADHTAPAISLVEITQMVDLDEHPDHVSYDEAALIRVSVVEPEGALGFPETYADNARLFYKVTASPGDPGPVDGTDYDAELDPLQWTSMYPYGGVMQYLIPESAYITNNRVWFWLNVSDTADPANANSTFASALQYFDIFDLNAPAFTFTQFGDVGYHEDEVVTYQLYKKPNEGTSITEFAIFYRQNNPTVNRYQYDGFFVYDPSNWTSVATVGSGTVANPWILDVSLLFSHEPSAYNFTFGDVYSFYFEARDANGNVRAETRSFTVTDTILPTGTLAAGNTHGIVFTSNKRVSISVADPGYASGQSAGIQAVYLYYKNGSAPASNDPGNFPGFAAAASVVPVGGEYQFTLDTSEVDYHYYHKRMSFIFVVVDGAGNSYVTPIQTFEIEDDINARVLAPAGLVAGQPYYTNQATLSLTVNLSLPAEAWLWVDETATALGYSNQSIRTVTVTFSAEREYDVRFCYYAPDLSRRLMLPVVYDATAPDRVTNVRAEATDTGFLVLWDPVADLLGHSIRYEVYRSRNASALGTCVGGCGDTFLTQARYSDGNAGDSGTYYYTVIAVDPAGNRSEAAQVTARAPFPQWAIYVIIIGAVAVVIGVVVKVKSGHDRTIISKTLARSTSDKAVGDEEINAFAQAAKKRKSKSKSKKKGTGTAPEPDETKWTSVTTGARASKKPARTSKQVPAKQYWHQESGVLVRHGLEQEASGDLMGALRRYELLERSAKRSQNAELERLAREKIAGIQGGLGLA